MKFLKSRQSLAHKRKPRLDREQFSKNGVFSYHTSKRSDVEPIRTSRSIQNESNSSGRPWWHHIPSIVATLVIIISFGYLLSLSTNPKIVPIKSINSDLLRSTQTYQQAARHILNGSLLNRSKITIDSNSFDQLMKQQFPELAEVSLILPISGRRPIVELAALQPSLILASPHGGNYLVADSGKVLMPASAAKAVANFRIPTVLDQSNLPITIGKGALTSTDVAFITTVILQLEAKQLTPSSVTLPPVPSELHVNLATQPYFIKFNLLGDPRVQAGDFLAVKQMLDNAHAVPKEYIDVRVESRVYYK